MNRKKHQYSIEVGGQPLELEVSHLADKANAAVLAKYGETIVLVTAVMSHRERDADFFPLMVDYEEKFYAAGKILGSRFVRREGRASDEAILSARLIDRTIRPLFDHRMRREVQIVVTILFGSSYLRVAILVFPGAGLGVPAIRESASTTSTVNSFSTPT